jgi:hypothetical protein
VKPWLARLLVATGATAVVLASLGPHSGGPGVTCDELYHVGLAGKPLATAVREQGFAFLLPENVRRNFHWPVGGPPVQAPLGHGILGLTHYLFDPAPDNPSVVSLSAARVAPALAFGLLVFLVAQWTWVRAGAVAGVVASFCAVLMPRLFAHAHFAALDMLTTTSCVAALFMVTWAARADAEGHPPNRLRAWSRYALAGMVWGVAMLIRLHGVLLLPPIGAWLLWRVGLFGTLMRRLRPHAEPPTCRVTGPLMWFAAGVVTLFFGWPWLWLNPIENLWRYLSSGAERHTLHVFYLGQVWADHEAPWHYPWLMFLWTVPVGFLALGAAGVFAWAHSMWKTGVVAGRGGLTAPRNRPARLAGPEDHPEREPALSTWNSACNDDFALLALAGIFLLCVFAWPGVPVYDGVRLFLVVFPLWAVFTGLGAKWLAERPVGRRLPQAARQTAIGLLVATQATGAVVYYPVHTGYYNLLVGGLWGAERMGLEVNYWGDSILEPLLAEAARVAPGRPVLYGPNLAPFQAPAVQMSSPTLAAEETVLVGWDASRPELAAACDYALIYRRRADLAAVDWVLQDGQIIAEFSRQGVWLARLVRISTGTPPRQAESSD